MSSVIFLNNCEKDDPGGIVLSFLLVTSFFIFRRFRAPIRLIVDAIIHLLAFQCSNAPYW